MGARHIPSQGPHTRCPRKSPLEAGLIHASILQGPVESAAPWPWRGGWGAVGIALLTWNPHSPSPQACKVTVTCPDLPRGRPGPGTSGRTGTCPQSHTRLVAGQRVEPWSLGIPQLLQLPPASLCALGSGDSRAEAFGQQVWPSASPARVCKGLAPFLSESGSPRWLLSHPVLVSLLWSRLVLARSPCLSLLRAVSLPSRQ